MQGYGLKWHGKWLFSTVTGKGAIGRACGRRWRKFLQPWGAHWGGDQTLPRWQQFVFSVWMEVGKSGSEMDLWISAETRQLNLCHAVSGSGRLRKGWSLWDLFEEKSVEKLARATPVELQQLAQHWVGDELQAAKVNSTLGMLTDKREKGGEMVVVEARRFDVCFQSGEIKHTLVLRGGRSQGKWQCTERSRKRVKQAPGRGEDGIACSA